VQTKEKILQRKAGNRLSVLSVHLKAGSELLPVRSGAGKLSLARKGEGKKGSASSGCLCFE
jgi:hypothetical protein